ncbi:MAG: AMP-binding protein [Acidimicrobiales bacterium]
MATQQPTGQTDWNYADVWEAVADAQPDAPALTQGDRRLSWSEMDSRADGLARWLLALDTEHQDKVALYLYNCPEYMEALFGTLKVGLVPVNTNYRYADDELVYLWDNADAVAVVFHGTFAGRVERVRSRVPRVRGWLWVDDGSGPCPEWAIRYEEAAKSAPGRVRAPWGRSGDDLVMLYTGGTTGMPKGVMWRQDDLFARMNAAGFRRYDPAGGLDGVRRVLAEQGPGSSLLPVCPLMHGTGGFVAEECLSEGGRLVLLESRHLDPIELLDTIEREKVNGIVIVGDPFARPMLAALDAEPDRWDLSSLVGIISSGAMWSEEVKEGLLSHHDMVLMDAFSSSEALGMGVSLSSGSSASRTAQFILGPEVRVLGADGRPVPAGSDEVGVLAIAGRNPLGYYKDEMKSAATFREIDGVRYSVPGDYAQVRADGSIHVLGRGSGTINTAGEKVFPEEVEEALKTHPGVRDAAVVGVPDTRYGELVVAVVEPAPGAEPGEAELIDHVKGRLARFKAPRRVRIVPSVGRAPNGKLDYRRHKEEAAEWAALQEAEGSR